ncbi:MAG: class I adenylate-forming enzyme family protein [Ilumatobacteraceae bacterium]
MSRAGSDDLISVLLSGGARGDRSCYAFIPAGTASATASISYADLLDRAHRAATGLRALGVQDGDRVALVARPDVGYVVTMAAALLAGGVAAPINHQFKQRELSAYCGVVEPAVVLTDATTDATVARVHSGPRITLDEVPGVASLAELERCEPAAPAVVRPTDTAFLLHTSGTTGLPKAVVRSHETYARFVHLWADRYMAPDDDVLSFMPMYHQGGVMMSFLPTYLRGRTTYQLERFSVPTFWSAARHHQTSWAVFMPPVPSFVRLHPELDPVHPFEWAMTGGRVDHWLEMQDRFGIVGHSGYGSTETTMVTMTGDRVDGPAGGNDVHGPLGGFACGHPIAGWNSLRVVRDDGSPAAPLEVGHLELSGPGVITEYFGRSTPPRRDGVWFRPGDVAYLDEVGRLFMVDRANDLIRRSGENISPREIEEVLQDHPAVDEAAVVPVEDEVRGQEIRACVVLRDGWTVTPDDLFRHCEEQLSAFKVPRFLEVRDALPHTPTMKIRKDVLVAEPPDQGWVDRFAGRGAG